MEVLFRKYFWTLNLVFLGLLAFLSAKTVNVFTEAAISPPPDFSPAPTNHATVMTLATRLSADALYKATGIAKPEEIKEPVVEAKPADDLGAEPVHTSLHAKLIGTVVASVPDWSWALIEDTQAHSNDVYMPKDKIQDATVLTIEEDQVIVLHDGHREIIDRNEGTGPVAVAAAPPPPSAPDIRETNDGNYVIGRAEVDKALNNLNELAMQARIVPAFKDGKATGFKLFSIRPDSLYSKIGIQNGDVISRINGFEINSPDKALEAYSKLKEASNIQLEIDRNGSTVSKNYQIQ